MKFLGQYDKYSCTAIAIINALKWRGCRVGYKDLEKVRKLCKTDNIITGNKSGRGAGTSTGNTISAISKLQPVLKAGKIIKNPTVDMIFNHLKDGGASIIDIWIPRHKWDGDTPHGHSYFAFMGPYGAMWAVNLHYKRNISVLGKQKLKIQLARKCKYFPRCWLLESWK